MTHATTTSGLVLWDVDHTLIETRGVGAHLYKAAFEEAAGAKMEEAANVTGAIEPEIFRETMRRNGLSPQKGNLDRYALLLEQQYDDNRNLLRKQGRPIQGAKEALLALGSVDGLVQTVLTGNLRQVARTKLEVFELAALLDLDVGAYGEDSESRPGLVSIAQESARQKYGRNFGAKDTVIIGDSTSDITTGQQGGAMVIAVASGKATAAELAEAGPDLVLDSLEDTTQVVKAVRGLLGR